jgi:ribosomal-protein-alanine N-acetyltransferase
MRRVELRAPTRADRDEYLAAMRASEALHHPWVHPPTTPEGYQRLLARAADERYKSLLACRVSDGAIVGYFNISEIVRGAFQSGFLGYGGVAAHAGRGYMTEGLELLITYAFGPLALHRLEANIQPANIRSIALVRRCGFVHEGFAPGYIKVDGRWRDHEHYAIRAEQWRARTAQTGGSGSGS